MTELVSGQNVMSDLRKMETPKSSCGWLQAGIIGSGVSVTSKIHRVHESVHSCRKVHEKKNSVQIHCASRGIQPYCQRSMSEKNYKEINIFD